MHPKLKNFMRTEPMECEVATSQAPPSDAAGSAIEHASEPQEMAATVAATPSDLGQGATQARLPEESPCPLKEVEVTKETQAVAVPKLRRTRSRNSKKSSEDSHPGDEDCDTDDELQWCSKGIAVFLSPDDEDETNGRTADGESMEVELSRKSETRCPIEQEQSKSMMACFKPKPKNCSAPSQLYPFSAATTQSSPTSFASGVPSTISLSTVKPSLPVTLASKSVPPPSIPHTFTPTNDIDMDTGESTAVALDNEEDQLKKCGQFVKLEEPESIRDCHVSSQSIPPNGCLVGNAPIYAHNPFTLMGNLPLIVKTEPGLSPTAMTHSRNSPLTGQSFISQVTGRSNGLFNLTSPIASLPPMEALHCMQLEDLMRMNFMPLNAIKQDQNQRVISLHGHRAHSFFQKPESKTPSVGNAAKMFTCQQCGATFKHRHHVVRHMRAHTGEKPFRCEECGAMFARKCILTNHIRTHTGEKPYVCTECGDAFSRKHHLVIHRRTHTGEKPYVCSVCSTAFARSHHLNRHLKTHILMQQGHLNGIPLHPDAALDLSLQEKLQDRVGAVDLSVQKAFISNGLPTTQVIETVTDCPPHVGQEEAVKS